MEATLETVITTIIYVHHVKIYTEVTTGVVLGASGIVWGWGSTEGKVWRGSTPSSPARGLAVILPQAPKRVFLPKMERYGAF